MRIHSSFKDYYDTALGWGADKTLHWTRKREIVTTMPVELRSILDSRLIFNPNPTRNSSAHVAILGFCGRVYPLIYDYGPIWTYARFLDSLERQVKKVEETKLNIHSRRYELRMIERAREGKATGWGDRTLGTLAGWEHMVSQLRVTDQTFRDLDTPIWVFTVERNKRVVVKNPLLTPYKFFQKFDAFTAFQEIEMYLGNQLARDRSVPAPITDELRAHAHGFDERSFRTDSPGKKARRRR